MQNFPAGWEDARNRLYRWETKATIAGIEYTEENIYSLKTSAALFSRNTAAIGGCVAKEIDLTVSPIGDIPRMAEIRLFVRPVASGVVTDWLPKGIFYIDTRETDNVTGIVTIHGYDAMLKAEQTFLTETTEDECPKPMSKVVKEIAKRMGVEKDEYSVISRTFMVEYPNDYTMREILGYIAAAHGGNWIMTDAGKLRLVRLGDLPREPNYLASEKNELIMFGDTAILV